MLNFSNETMNTLINGSAMALFVASFYALCLCLCLTFAPAKPRRKR